MPGPALILSPWGLGRLWRGVNPPFAPGLGVLSGPIEIEQAQDLISFIRGIQGVAISQNLVGRIVSMTKSAASNPPIEYLVGRQYRNLVHLTDTTDVIPKRRRLSSASTETVVGVWHWHPQQGKTTPCRDSDPYHLIGRGKVGAQMIIVSQVEVMPQYVTGPPNEKVVNDVRIAVWKVANFGQRLEIMWDKDEFRWEGAMVQKGQIWDTDVWLEPAAWEVVS